MLLGGRCNMANTTFPQHSDDDTAFRLITSVVIEDIEDVPEEDIANMAHGVLDALQSMVKDSTALQDYPEIASEADDDYRYAGG